MLKDLGTEPPQYFRGLWAWITVHRKAGNVRELDQLWNEIRDHGAGHVRRDGFGVRIALDKTALFVIVAQEPRVSQGSRFIPAGGTHRLCSTLEIGKPPFVNGKVH